MKPNGRSLPIRLRHKNGSAFADVMTIVQKTGGIEATREAAAAHQTLAREALDSLDQNDAVGALRTMADNAVDRQG